MRGKFIFIIAILMCAFIAGCNKQPGKTVTGSQTIFIDEVIASGSDNGLVVDVNQLELSDAQAMATITYYYSDGTELDDIYLNIQCNINGDTLSGNWSASEKISNDSNDKIQQTFYFEYGSAVPEQDNSVKLILEGNSKEGVLADEIAQIEITIDNIGLQYAVGKSEAVTFETKEGDMISDLKLMCTDMQYTLCFKADDKFADEAYYFVGVDNLDRDYLFAEAVKGNDGQIVLHCYTVTGSKTAIITELPSDCEYINITMYKGEADTENNSKSAVSDDITIKINMANEQ